MDASKKYLLITRPNTTRAIVQRAILWPRSPEAFEFPLPLWWLIFGKLKEAQIIDSDLTLYNVEARRMLGVASRKLLKAPVIGYFLLMVIGALTLSIPMRVMITMAAKRQLEMNEIKNYTKAQYKLNPSNTSEDCEQMDARIDRAESFEMLVASFTQH